MCSNQVGLAVAPTTSFPSPARGYYQGPISLDRELIRNPASTYLLRVDGAGLASAGVVDGAVLVVDRSLDLLPGLVVVVVTDGEHRVGRLVELDGRPALATDACVLPLPADARRWGVVTAVVQHFWHPGGSRGGG